ncbi:MAG: restriction endonuclease [Bacteroidetes bacterium]|nr:restriction endonuclease [Bacteroidota bacterium]
MLTPSDIHYLVGLLTNNDTGTDLDIELGDMVYDASVKKERDVDVTVTKTLFDGTKEIYGAYEVKDHSKPLDVTHVEQLCIKMADMPAIKAKHIVSSSGYTEPAKLKAASHNVKLLEIVPWNDTTKGFDFWTTSKKNYQFKDVFFIWPEYTVYFNFDLPEPIEASQPMNDFLPVCNENGEPFPQVKIFKDLVPYVFNAMKAEWSKSDLSKSMALESSMRIKHEDFAFSEQTFVQIDDQKIKIKNAEFYGIVTKTSLAHYGIFKILRKVGEEKPISGCAIFISKDGHLAGLALSNVTQKASLIWVPYEDRIKKIFKKKLTRYNKSK